MIYAVLNENTLWQIHQEAYLHLTMSWHCSLAN